MSKEIDCNEPEFFRTLQQAMQIYALSITAGFFQSAHPMLLSRKITSKLKEDERTDQEGAP
jgi:hypothetical protein